MRITAISSTPRRGGNSDILVDRVVAAALDRGARATKISVAALNLAPCTACDACLDAYETPCVIDDDANSILDEIRQSDAIVFGTPIYNFTVSAQLKLLLDRMYALGGPDGWDALAGRRIGVLLTYADENRAESGVENAIGMFRDMARFLKVGIEGIIEAQCNKPGEVLDIPEALAAAEQLGVRLAAEPGQGAG